MSFTPITNLPSNLFPWWISNDPGYPGINPCLVRDSSTGSVLPNCTGWAWGAFAWHWGNNVPAQIWGWRDAKNWYNDAVTVANYQRGQDPVLGAIICFTETNGAGHVACVEQITDNGQSIYCSESDYSGNQFTYRKRTKASGWLEAGGSQTLIFQGFIYPPVVQSPIITLLKRKKKGVKRIAVLI